MNTFFTIAIVAVMMWKSNGFSCEIVREYPDHLSALIDCDSQYSPKEIVDHALECFGRNMNREFTFETLVHELCNDLNETFRIAGKSCEPGFRVLIERNMERLREASKKTNECFYNHLIEIGVIDVDYDEK